MVVLFVFGILGNFVGEEVSWVEEKILRILNVKWCCFFVSIDSFLFIVGVLGYFLYCN